MTSRRWTRGLWIVAAGAGIALGAGHGIAAAESDSPSSGAGPSSPQSGQTSAPSTGVTSSDAKDVAKDHDSSSGAKGAKGAKDADKPTSSVSASTVTVDDDGTDSSTTVVTPAKVTKQAKSPTPAMQARITALATAASAVTKPVDTTPPKNATAEDVAPEDVAQKDDAVGDVSAIRTLAAPVATATTAARPAPGPIATVVISLLSAFGLLPPAPPAPVSVTGIPAQTTPGTSSNGGVTGVKVGSSSLDIPVGSSTYTGAADWYFPTQDDGTVQAQGVTLLQHGFLGSNFWYSALAQQLSRQTNSIVVVPNIPSFSFFTCAGCSLSDVAMQQGVAALFADPNRTSLNASAEAAGYHGLLPTKFVLTGHSAGGGLAAAAGGFYTRAVAPSDSDLLGVVMFDGVSSNGTFAGALDTLRAENIPIYQIAAPPQAWNANGQTTADLVAQQRPGQFLGVTLANGSHVDSLIGGSPTIDFLSQLLIKPSPVGNTAAVYTLSTGWINDLYAGRGPATPRYGVYGMPNQNLVLGPTAAVVLGPAPVVDVDRYLGTWDEVGVPSSS